MTAETKPNSGRDGGWIEWHGGELGGGPPVPHDTPGLQVRCRNGVEHDARGFLSHYWFHDGDSRDIIAYRVVKEAEPPQPTRGGVVGVPVEAIETVADDLREASRAWHGSHNGLSQSLMDMALALEAMLSAAPSVSHGGGGMREVVAAAHWQSERKHSLADGHDPGPWPPTAGSFGWQEDDAEAICAMRREAAAAILAALQDHGARGEGSGWQDISTAPKTSEANMVAVPFIGWCPEPEADGGGDQRICWWEPKTDGGKWWSDRDLPEHPTLWRALPAGPLDGTK